MGVSGGDGGILDGLQSYGSRGFEGLQHVRRTVRRVEGSNDNVDRCVAHGRSPGLAVLDDHVAAADIAALYRGALTIGLLLIADAAYRWRIGQLMPGRTRPWYQAVSPEATRRRREAR